MAGEYGTQDGGLGRPHFHALLFGFDFRDKTFWEEKNSNRFYRSNTLEKLWPYGFSNITDVNFKTAAYVARYVMKKINGELANEHYRKVDPETGEIYQIEPEYNGMSLRPGIAYDWFEKYKADVFPHDYVVIDGKKVKTPAYYTKRLQAINPEEFEGVKNRRAILANKHASNNTPERLQVREACAVSNLNRTKRNLE